MLQSHSRRASKGRHHKRTTTKSILKSSSAKFDLDRLAIDLAQEWCSGSDIFHQHLYVE